jgi:type 1 fimbria pilin
MMKLTPTTKMAALAAATLLALSSTALSAERGGRAASNGANAENGCAIGNTPPAGANCSP